MSILYGNEYPRAMTRKLLREFVDVYMFPSCGESERFVESKQFYFALIVRRCIICYKTPTIF